MFNYNDPTIGFGFFVFEKQKKIEQYKNEIEELKNEKRDLEFNLICVTDADKKEYINNRIKEIDLRIMELKDELEREN